MIDVEYIRIARYRVGVEKGERESEVQEGRRAYGRQSKIVPAGDGFVMLAYI